jgi:hypothetical protein
MSDSEAERLLAAIWRVLEEQALATPLLNVRSANGLFHIVATFQSSGDRELVFANLALSERERNALAAVDVEAAQSETRFVVDAVRQQDVRDRIRKWRQRAEELRTAADQFVIPSAQETMRRIAGNYEQLADDGESLLEGHPSTKKTDRTG